MNLTACVGAHFVCLYIPPTLQETALPGPNAQVAGLGLISAFALSQAGMETPFVTIYTLHALLIALFADGDAKPDIIRGVAELQVGRCVYRLFSLLGAGLPDLFSLHLASAILLTRTGILVCSANHFICCCRRK